MPGHRLLARGLSGPVPLPLPEDEDEDEDMNGSQGDVGPVEEYRSPERVVEDVAGGRDYPGFSLEYELVPGLGEDHRFFDALVGIEYEADVPLPWDPGDQGALAPFEGGSSTHGSRGDWPLPPDARVLTFTVWPPMHVGGDPLGRLLLELGSGKATWTAGPAGEESA